MDICIDKQVLQLCLGDSLYNQFPSHRKITRNDKLRISSFLKFKRSFPSEQIVSISNVEHSLQQLYLPVRKKSKSPLNTNFLVVSHIFFSTSWCHSSNLIQRYLTWLVLTMTHFSRGNTSYRTSNKTASEIWINLPKMTAVNSCLD